jgi:hypothetical protein
MDTGGGGLLSGTCHDEGNPCYPNDRQVNPGQPCASERKAQADEGIKASEEQWILLINHPARAKRANRKDRVLADSLPLRQATSRRQLRATAVNTCCRCVLANPDSGPGAGCRPGYVASESLRGQLVADGGTATLVSAAPAECVRGLHDEAGAVSTDGVVRFWHACSRNGPGRLGTLHDQI